MLRGFDSYSLERNSPNATTFTRLRHLPHSCLNILEDGFYETSSPPVERNATYKVAVILIVEKLFSSFTCLPAIHCPPFSACKHSYRFTQYTSHTSRTCVGISHLFLLNTVTVHLFCRPQMALEDGLRRPQKFHVHLVFSWFLFWLFLYNRPKTYARSWELGQKKLATFPYNNVLTNQEKGNITRRNDHSSQHKYSCQPLCSLKLHYALPHESNIVAYRPSLLRFYHDVAGSITDRCFHRLKKLKREQSILH